MKIGRLEITYCIHNPYERVLLFGDKITGMLFSRCYSNTILAFLVWNYGLALIWNYKKRRK